MAHVNRSLSAVGVLVLSLASLLSVGCTGRTIMPQRTEAQTTPSAIETPGRPDVDVISIAAVGDIMLASPFPNDTRMPPNDGADLLDKVTPILSKADIAFGNMEGPIVDDGISEKCPEPKPVPPGEKPPPVRCFAFRMPTSYAKHLKDAGFDVLSVANNHASDFGEAGRSSTRKTLDALGIKHVGSNRTQYSTTILEVNGKNVAFVGFAHNPISPNVNDLAAARELVLAAAKRANIVVVSFHGGAEGTAAQNVPKQTELFFGEKRGNLPLFARTVIDAGADLVLGHGPHVLRGMEVYKDRLVAYSLGNFATYGWFRLDAELALTMVLEVQLAADGRFVSGQIHSAKQEGRGVPVPDTSSAALAKVRALSKADFPATSPKFADDGGISPN